MYDCSIVSIAWYFIIWFVIFVYFLHLKCVTIYCPELCAIVNFILAYFAVLLKYWEFLAQSLLNFLGVLVTLRHYDDLYVYTHTEPKFTHIQPKHTQTLSHTHTDPKHTHTQNQQIFVSHSSTTSGGDVVVQHH